MIEVINSTRQDYVKPEKQPTTEQLMLVELRAIRAALEAKP